MLHVLPLLIGFLAGMALTAVLLRRPRGQRSAGRQSGLLEAARADALEADGVSPPEGSAAHLISLLGSSLRGPLRRLRRVEGCPGDVLDRLEHVAWQARMLTSRPRPMKAQPTSAMTLLQEAAERVPRLRDGTVTAKWSLLQRQPVHVDPERARAAFRELLGAGAEAAGEGGRLGIRVQPSEESGYPVEVEVTIARSGAEIDSLSLLVARHLLEDQGARLRIDGNVARVALRHAAPELGALA